MKKYKPSAEKKSRFIRVTFFRFHVLTNREALCYNASGQIKEKGGCAMTMKIYLNSNVHTQPPLA